MKLKLFFFWVLVRNVFKAWGFSLHSLYEELDLVLCNSSNVSSGSGTIFLDYLDGVVGDSRQEM